ncbi:MAG: YchJ family protein [Cellvibrionales bacterium]
MIKTCSCGSRQTFEACCKPHLDGIRRADIPEQLVRSRYTAYALGGYGDFLLRTWFPVTAKGLIAAELSIVTQHWTGLEIRGSGIDGHAGWVEFRATYGSAAGVSSSLHEKSVFSRVAGSWLYIGGEVLKS